MSRKHRQVSVSNRKPTINFIMPNHAISLTGASQFFYLQRCYLPNILAMECDNMETLK